MNLTGILIAALIVGGTGLFIGIFLGVAGKKFAVEVNEMEEAILSCLPGNNCGGCGYAGCAALAAAIANGEAPANACPVGGAAVAAKVAEMKGESVEESTRMVAFVKCAGTCEKAAQVYEYTGIRDCVIASNMPNGGSKGCSYGCLGFGNCVKACPFDAIHVVDGIAVVDKEACKACGKCIAACPKHMIELIPYDQQYMVHCNSHDKGKDVMSVCTTGCIGCMLCKKACAFDAVEIQNNLAHINPDKCQNCGACAAKCPKKVIF